MAEEYCIRIQRASTQWYESVVKANDIAHAKQQGQEMLKNVNPYEDKDVYALDDWTGDVYRDIYVEIVYPMSEVRYDDPFTLRKEIVSNENVSEENENVSD